MNVKLFFIVFVSVVSVFPSFAQKKGQAEYRKFYLSISGGLDYTLGTTNTVLSQYHILPPTKKSFVPGFEGAYFFAKNYGIGIKYNYYSDEYSKFTYSEYKDSGYDFPVHEASNISFKEQTYFLGPAFFARWSLGRSKWTVSMDMGTVYVHDRLSKILFVKKYLFSTDTLVELPQNPSDDDFPAGRVTPHMDLIGTNVGFTFSGGIHYRIIPFLGVGIQINDLVASYSGKIKGTDTSISRTLDRIGLSASVDLSF